MRALRLRLLPVLIVVPLALAGATGCQRLRSSRPDASGASAAAKTQGAAVPQIPPPFSSPVVTGTPDVATLVAKVKPAVVNITTIQKTRLRRPMDEMDPFGYFQHRFGYRPGPDQVMRQKALGSGFIIDGAGHVVTNAHVVEGADEVRVKLADDREFDAKVVGRDQRIDLALLQLQDAPKDLPAASLGASDALRVGEYVVAIGNPFGLGHTVTMGIVSAKGRSIGAGPYDDFIQTDASINPGNSGGPLFDLQGRVVGINSAINPNGQGIGFAIPIDMLEQVLPQLLATGHVERGRLGVAFRAIDPHLAKKLDLDGEHGAYVAQVEPDSPADRAGIRQGDVITKVEGRDVAHAEELPRMVALRAPGTKLSIEVLRDGKPRRFEVELGRMREAQRSVDDEQPSD